MSSPFFRAKNILPMHVHNVKNIKKNVKFGIATLINSNALTLDSIKTNHRLTSSVEFFLII